MDVNVSYFLNHEMLFLSEKLKWFVKRNLKGILLGDLNTNSIKSKLDQIKGNVDIMSISFLKRNSMSLPQMGSSGFHDMLLIFV